MLEKEEIGEKIEKGWIRSRVWFEVLAVKKEIALSSLKTHLEKLGKQDGIRIISEKLEEAKSVEKPMSNVDEGFSQAAEVELLSDSVETLLSVVIFFVPSAVEILEPKKLTVEDRSVQVIMNSVADLIHRYAAREIGGYLIPGAK